MLKESKLFHGYFLSSNAFYIERGNPRGSILTLQQAAQFVKQTNRGLIIFPEGTRSEAGTTGKYQPGGVILAHKAESGILPLAHNAGALWPKRGFIKKPGTITFRFLPYISAGEVNSVHRTELLKKLERDIESATRELGG